MGYKGSTDNFDFELDNYETHERNPFGPIEKGHLTEPDPTRIQTNAKTVYAVNQSMNVVHTDTNGKILYGNQNIYDLTLYKPEELIGKNPRIFNANYHSKEFFSEMWDTILSGKIWRGDVKNKRKDGTVIWVRLIITPLLDDSGLPYQFVALKEDITEKKEMEFRLAQKDKQLSALTNNSYDIVGIIDKEGEIIYLNPAFERILGFTPTESIGFNLDQFIDEESIPFKSCILQKIFDIPSEPIRHQVKFKHKDGTIRWCDIVFSNYLEDPHINGVIFNIRDYTKQKEATDIINHYANYDYLTGLANRRYFESHLKDTLKKAKSTNQPFALLSLDLDGFKHINDTYGHEIGDKLLKKVGQRISCVSKEDAFVGRLGGDEFSILLPRIAELKNVHTLADSLIRAFTNPFKCGDSEINISASIGISIYPSAGKDITTLLRNADVAMYKAKKNGKNHYLFFDSMVHGEVF